MTNLNHCLDIYFHLLMESWCMNAWRMISSHSFKYSCKSMLWTRWRFDVLIGSLMQDYMKNGRSIQNSKNLKLQYRKYSLLNERDYMPKLFDYQKTKASKLHKLHPFKLFLTKIWSCLHQITIYDCIQTCPRTKNYLLFSKKIKKKKRFSCWLNEILSWFKDGSSSFNIHVFFKEPSRLLFG